MPITEPIVHQAVQNYTGCEDVKITSIDQKPASDSMLGFLGEHTRITVRYVLKGSESQISFFGKSYPKDNEQQAALNDQYDTFEKEIATYIKIINRFEDNLEFEQWHGKCYFAKEDTLVLEDLALRGFAIADINSTFDEAHCTTALQSIARFHSEWIALEEKESAKRGELYRLENEYGSIFDNSFLGYSEWMKTGVATLVTILHKMNKYMDNIHEIKRRTNIIYKRSNDLFKPSKTMRNVLIHNDLWNNNMMFRYKNDEPVQCMLVDFQGAFIAPPTIDITSLLYLNLDRKLREEKLDIFLKSYYKEYARKLLSHSINPDDVLTWDEFRESYEEFKLFGLVHGLVLFQFLFLSSEDKAKMVNDSEYFTFMQSEERVDTFIVSLKSNPVCEKRFVSLIDEFMECYVLRIK